MSAEVIAGLIGLLTAIVLAIRKYVESKDIKPRKKPDAIEDYNKAVVDGDADTVNVAHYEHDRRLLKLVERWKRRKRESGSNQ